MNFSLRMSICCVLIICTFIASGCSGSTSTKPAKSKVPTTNSGSTSPSDAPASVDPKRVDVDTSHQADLVKLLDDPIADKAIAAGCSMGVREAPKSSQSYHVDHPKWKVNPPTNGQHDADWLAFGRYDKPVPDRYAVHNLEHGGVAVWLGAGLPSSFAADLDERLDSGEKWIVSPRPKIDGVASGFWFGILYCPSASVKTLGQGPTIDLLDRWYSKINSQGSEAEGAMPAYAGRQKTPKPKHDISLK